MSMLLLSYHIVSIYSSLISCNNTTLDPQILNSFGEPLLNRGVTSILLGLPVNKALLDLGNR